MKIAELLASQGEVDHASIDHLYIDGFISRDTDPEWIRVYTNPTDKGFYFLIRVADASGDIYEWSDHERAVAGHVNVKMHRVPVKRGTEAFSVTVTSEKLGVTVTPENPEFLAKHGGGDCRKSTFCPRKCCTQTGPGRCGCDNCCIA